MREDHTTVLRVEPREDFVVTPSIQAICERALAYLDAGYPVHLRGPAGTGKTTLAMHIAGLRGKPMVLLYGDDEFGTSDLVGGEKGILSKRVIDNFVHSVLKTEESVRTQWVDNRITTACKDGYTLVYDEFSRSRPEANNILLAILEEGILPLPASRYGETYMPVHPDFRAIFTSNPEEYAGVHKAQDALLDRMMTIELTYYDRETEIAITMAKSGLPRREAEKIVDLVRHMRRKRVNHHQPTVRACIMIAKIIASRGGKVMPQAPFFLDTCIDILGMNGSKTKKVSKAKEEVESFLRRYGNVKAKRKEENRRRLS